MSDGRRDVGRTEDLAVALYKATINTFGTAKISLMRKWNNFIPLMRISMKGGLVKWPNRNSVSEIWKEGNIYIYI